METNENTNRSKEQVSIRRYLLGVLTEADSGRFEQQYLEDEELFEKMQEEEDELIDAYAGEALSDQERLRFEEFFLCSPERREKLQFAIAMTERAVRWKDQTRVSPKTTPVGAQGPIATSAEENHRMGKMLPFDRGSRTVPAWRLWGAIAAGVLIAIGTGALWLSNRELHRDLLNARAEQTQLRREFDAASARVEPAETQAAAEKKQSEEQATASRDQIQALTEKLEQVQPPSIASAFVGLANLAIVTRGGILGKPKTIRVPPNARVVRLSVEFEATRFQTFTAALQRGEENQVWSSSGPVEARTSGSRQNLTLNIPAQSLRAGKYQLIVRPADAEGKDVRYVLNIVR